MSTEELDHDRVLMMKALDGYLSDAELAEWERRLTANDALRHEFEAFRGTQQRLDAFRTRALANLHAREAERGGRGVGLVTAALVGGGTLLVGAVTLILFFALPDVPLWLKLGVGAVTLGFLVAFIKIVLDRLRAAPHDRYTEVDR